jgi:Tfp pilus assembly protein PilO
MKKERILDIQEHSGIFLIIALGFLVLAAFFLLWIKPACKSLDTYEKRIEELQLKVEKQDRLAPLHLQLTQRKKAVIPEGMDIKEKTKLKKAELDMFVSGFKMLTEKTGMAMLAITPDLSASDNNPGFITAETKVTGSFFAFRDFLLELTKLPYLEYIEAVFIIQKDNQKEFNMKLWLATE